MQNLGWTALAALGALAICGQAAAQPSALVARGDYLVNAIAGCNDCHTPMTPRGPDMTKALQGAPLMFAPTMQMPWAPVAPPLAGGPAGYTEAQLIAFLRTGARPDGTTPLPPMPAYRLNEEDARAVTAYVRSLAPAR